MKTVVYQVDSFTKEKFSGNPAGVVPNADGLSDEQMQKIARELNNSETAFIFSPDSDDHDVHVRFFTPATEVPSCGHATIAAHYIRAIDNNLVQATVIQKTKIGKLPVDIIREDGDYKIWMTQGTPKFSEPLDEQNTQKLLHALKLSDGDINHTSPIQFVDTGHGKVILQINSLQKLHSLNPDFDVLQKISSVTGYKGFFIFTLESHDAGILTNGRMFAPFVGINEDPVTGNAHGPLGAYLVKNNLVKHDGKFFKFTGKQGEAMKRPGNVDVEVTIDDSQPVKVRIGGKAVIVFKTEIEVQ